MCLMAKTTSINLRISPEFRKEIEILAEYHGLSMSSLAHSLLVKAVRRAVEEAAAEGMQIKKSGIRAARIKVQRDDDKIRKTG